MKCCDIVMKSVVKGAPVTRTSNDTQMSLTIKRAFCTASGEDNYICVIYIWHSLCSWKSNCVLWFLRGIRIICYLNGISWSPLIRFKKASSELCRYTFLVFLECQNKYWCGPQKYLYMLALKNSFEFMYHLQFWAFATKINTYWLKCPPASDRSFDSYVTSHSPILVEAHNCDT